MKIRAVFYMLVVFSVLSVGCKKTTPPEHSEAIQLVSVHMYEHHLNISDIDLASQPNPQGEGIFIFAEKPDMYGVTQKALWLVFEEQVYPLSRVAKQVTPALKWPSDMSPENWDLTGLNLYSFHKPMQWVFG